MKEKDITELHRLNQIVDALIKYRKKDNGDKKYNGMEVIMNERRRIVVI